MRPSSTTSQYRSMFFSHVNARWPKEVMGHSIMTKKVYDQTIKETVSCRERAKEAKSKKQRCELLKQYREYKYKIIFANIRFIVQEAARYRVDPSKFDDLISECMLAFGQAIDKIDPERGRLTTYAPWWIRQRVSRFIMRDNIVTYPAYLYERRAVPEYNLDYLDEPDFLTGKPVEMEGCEPEPDSLVYNEQMKKAVCKYLQNLTPREREVISRRFGLEGYDEHTLGEVGELFGLTRERIRQIQLKAIMKIRNYIARWETRTSK